MPKEKDNSVIKVNTMSNLLKDNKTLLAEFDTKKNPEIDIDTITLGSNKKVWWRCPKGHEWQAVIAGRSKGNSCPYCSGKKVLAGFNDLATLRPDLLKEWNYEKNSSDGISPEGVTCKSGKKVWWKCPKCGTEYYSKVATVSNGHLCARCARKRIGELNSRVTPDKIKNARRVSDYPEIAKEWDYQKNGVLTPETVLAGSEKKIWWRCPRNHSYLAIPGNRIKGHTGCPYCAGKKVLSGFNDFASQFPDLAEMWNYEKNEILPSQITSHSNKSVWWKCPKCGHEWKANPNNIVNGQNCPRCSSSLRTSLPEQAIYYYLSKVENATSRETIDGWEVDVFLPDYSIAIEYDGLYYHSSEDVLERERRKNEALSKSRIHLIRVKESVSLEEDTDDVIYNDVRKGYKNLSDAIGRLLSRLSILTGNTYNTDVDVDFDRDRADILSAYKSYTQKNSIVASNPEIVSEWNYQKNGNLKPEMFSHGSGERVWWICSKGHEWKATIASRAKGATCPYCSGFKWLPGEGDLKTSFPDIAKEWDFSKNEGLDPTQINPGSRLKVWWRCPNGHSYQATPLNRTNPMNHCGCPFCSNKRVLRGFNDLATTNPDVIPYWDYRKNKEITPEDVTSGSSKVVWWVCSNGHEFEKRIVSYISHPNCPICSERQLVVGVNDLKTKYPNLAREWNYEKNEILPDSVTRTYNKKVWWKCSTCGHEWQQSVKVRFLAGCGCPKCRHRNKGDETPRRNGQE